MIAVARSENCINVEDFPDVSDFCNKGEYMSWGECMLLRHVDENEDVFIYSKDGVGFRVNYNVDVVKDGPFHTDRYVDLESAKFDDDDPLAFIVANVGSKEVFIFNGDLNEDELIEWYHIQELCPNSNITSFSCIQELLEYDICRIYGIKKHSSEPLDESLFMGYFSKAISDGYITIHDIINDDTIEIRLQDKTEIVKSFVLDYDEYDGTPSYGGIISRYGVRAIVENMGQSPLTPPKKGYSLAYAFGRLVWHKPASLLFSFEDQTYLIGQDEGTFFGCEVEDNPRTITQAYKSLIPEEIRNCRNLIRQGEWFLKRINKSERPTLEEVKAFGMEVILPIDDVNSNTHTIRGFSFITEDGIYVSTCCQNYLQSFGGDFMNIRLEHDEHEPIIIECVDTDGNYVDKWFKIYKNTAVRSVSVEGVD